MRQKIIERFQESQVTSSLVDNTEELPFLKEIN